MKNPLIALFLLLFSCTLNAQFNNVDTIINQENYRSYFSFKYQNPIAVTYKLYQGGGSCSRTPFFFKGDSVIQCLTAFDYLKSGYDKGHLANAKDFAYSCQLEELTFRYYNCVPQTPTLNRGMWKVLETKIRLLSQTDSLLVVCYNDFNNTKINNIPVPTSCVKAVYSLTKRQWITIVMFTNTLSPIMTELTEAQTQFKFKISLCQLIY